MEAQDCPTGLAPSPPAPSPFALEEPTSRTPPSFNAESLECWRNPNQELRVARHCAQGNGRWVSDSLAQPQKQPLHHAVKSGAPHGTYRGLPGWAGMGCNPSPPVLHGHLGERDASQPLQPPCATWWKKATGSPWAKTKVPLSSLGLVVFFKRRFDVTGKFPTAPKVVMAVVVAAAPPGLCGAEQEA